MAARKILFVDRDGTLIVEPADQQVDRLDKLALVPGVIPALLALVQAGWELVMVSNQDGLGTDSFPEADFWPAHNLMLQIFESQGIRFSDTLIDRSFEHENAPTRKPRIGLVLPYLREGRIDFRYSAMVGDRETDIEFATNLGVRGFLLRDGHWDWPAIARELLATPRRARVERRTKETEIRVAVDLDREGEPRVATGVGFFDHMLEQLGKHGGFALELECDGDLQIDEHHTVEDCALALGQALREALGDKRGIARYGFLLPMDETRVQVALDLSGRPYAVFEGRFPRERVGGLATELVPHFFRSLAETLGANLHIRVEGDNAHHMVEACFKGVARSLRQAIRVEGSALPSTKGAL